jgi:hypothetical protein
MQFNPATEYNSMVKAIDDLVDTNVSKYTLAQKARAVNSGLDKAYSVLFNSVDTKNFDDHNFAKLPQGTYDITIGERNLTVYKDEEGAEILKIYKVFARNSNGDAYELEAKDIRQDDAYAIAYGDDTGVIQAYDWVGTSMVFDVTPEATIANGLKIFYMRNASYFTEADTTKEPGLPALFHDYLVYYASWQYAMTKGLQRKNDLKAELDALAKGLAEFASAQSLENNIRLTPMQNNVI